MEKKQSLRTFAGFMLLMIALGASDAVRGVFTPIFSEHFSLNAGQLSAIVTSAYVGNLVFMLFGSPIVDKLPRRVSLIGLLILWMSALSLYCITDSYPMLLVGAFLSLGCSTLLSTTTNLCTTMLFASSPGLMVNFLYFVQCIGTSGGQSLVGNLAKSFGAWKIINLILIGMGLVAMLILLKGALPPKDAFGSKKTGGLKEIAASPAFWMLIFIFATYFVAEHGIMNWLVAYANLELGIAMGTAANVVAVFYACIMVGRLIFSPLVDRLGVFRSIRYASLAALVLFVIGTVSGAKLLWIISISGIFFSIIYPTLVMCISRFYHPSILSSASGMIISIASLGDILFNAVFGSIVDAIGYAKAFLIMPGAMIVFTALVVVFTVRADKAGR